MTHGGCNRSLQIGDRVQVVRWAPDVQAIPMAFYCWVVTGETRRLEYYEAVGHLELVRDWWGEPAYYVRLIQEPESRRRYYGRFDDWESVASKRSNRIVIAREVVSLEPIEVEPVRRRRKAAAYAH